MDDEKGSGVLEVLLLRNMYMKEYVVAFVFTTTGQSGSLVRLTGTAQPRGVLTSTRATRVLATPQSLFGFMVTRTYPCSPQVVPQLFLMIQVPHEAEPVGGLQPTCNDGYTCNHALCFHQTHQQHGVVDAAKCRLWAARKHAALVGHKVVIRVERNDLRALLQRALHGLDVAISGKGGPPVYGADIPLPGQHRTRPRSRLDRARVPGPGVWQRVVWPCGLQARHA